MIKPVWAIFSSLSMLMMLIVFAVSTFLGGCNSQVELANGSTTFMKCHWTFVADAIVAVAGFVIAFVSGFAKGEEGRRLMVIAQIAAFCALALMPTPLGIGLCANADMACHMTAYITWGACAVGIILSVIQLVKANPEANEKPKMQL